MLNFNHLYYFHVAASESSLTNAATQLGVSLSTVSEQIRLLERSLGVRLFERAPGGLQLTTAGKAAFEHTSVMFRAGERLTQTLGQKPLTTPFVLNVGITATVSRTLATDFLMPVLALPECYPSIQTASFRELLRDLRGNDLDLVLCETEPPEPARRGLELTTLHRPRLIAIGRPDLRPSETWDDVKLLTFRHGSGYRWEIDHYLDEHGLHPQTVGETDDSFLLLEAVVRGGFVAFVPRSVARDALATGRVRELAHLDAEGAAVYALYRDDQSTQLVRQAVETLTAYATTLEGAGRALA